MKAIDRFKHKRMECHKSFLVRLAGYYFLLVACPVFGQVLPKKTLTEADYHLWSTLVNLGISDHGQWSSYLLQYEQADTLFVKHTKTGKTFAFPKTYDGQFNGEEWFACKRNDTLRLQDLKTGQFSLMPHINNYSFSGDGKYLLLTCREENGKESLTVKDMKGNFVAYADDVNAWKWNEGRTAIAFASDGGKQQTVNLLSLGNSVTKREIIADRAGQFINLAWKGKYIAFMQERLGGAVLSWYDSQTKQTVSFDPKAAANFPAGMSVSLYFDSVTVSPDGARVFFKLKEPAFTDPNAGIVQVWGGNDKQLPPSLKLYGDLTLRDKDAVWFVKEGRFLQVGTRELPEVSISSDGRYAVSRNLLAYEPQSDHDSPIDVYITELATGKRDRILKKHSGSEMSIMLSPGGKYLTYVKDLHWWVYDIGKGIHTDLTSQLKIPFHKLDFDWAGEIPMYGNPGWTVNDQSMLVYDQYDIWEISPDGQQQKRLTHGRENETIFRLLYTSPMHKTLYGGIELTKGVFDLREQQLVSAEHKATGFNGIYSLAGGMTLKQLDWSYHRTHQLMKAKKSNAFTYIAESYGLPPGLIAYEPKGKTNTVFKSNQQHDQYHWGKTERITYSVDGKKLSGILMLPANYDSSKKYPMVVYIYERLGYVRHEYQNPTLYNEGGFNVANLSGKGYFVLFPDIAYQMRDMGESAKKCVLTAVDTVLAEWNVDAKRLGLFGHSFGGYETDYIITKTDRFAAAVSGAALTDLVSSYLYVGATIARPDFWRYEYHQQRMERSLFEDPQSYLRNSPILQAEGVTTPLLSYTGEDDRHVNYLQSIEFYLALRRLGKEQVMLVYPGEQHALVDKTKQADLTHRVEDWFAKYLKP